MIFHCTESGVDVKINDVGDVLIYRDNPVIGLDELPIRSFQARVQLLPEQLVSSIGISLRV